jgi:hypothetical protein
MAQEESPREDLLREATALVERVELVEATDHPIVAGFRHDGALSIFFGNDEVYHFNAAGDLRRAYLDGHLYKALNGELVRMTRVRTAQQVELRSHALDAAEQADFISTMRDRLAGLTAALAKNAFEARREVPPGANIVDRLREWLTQHASVPIAKRPNA